MQLWYTEFVDEEIQITDATTQDAHVIGQIQSEAWLDSYASPENGITKEDIQLKVDEWNKIGDTRIEDNLNNPNSRTWVVKIDEKIVGFSAVLKTENENKLEAIFILPKYQGQGIGSKLLETTLNWLGNSKKITTDVVSYNERAKNLYKKFGFEETEETVDDVLTLPNGKIIPKILMVKS